MLRLVSGITQEDVDAYWLGTMNSGLSGMVLPSRWHGVQAGHPGGELLRDRL